MALEDTELTIGGVSFKGVYIAILLSLATTLGGGVWTASSLYSRLESLEAQEIPDVVPIGEEVMRVEAQLEEQIKLIQQELVANDVSQLQGKLAELGVNLKTIAEQQSKLLEIKDDVEAMQQKLIAMETVVQKAEMVTAETEEMKKQTATMKREIQDLWDGMDYLSNPLN
jgi:DNA repair exonuclease SbcCD ATPase subunit